MVNMISWGLFVVGMLSGIAITMVMYVLVWDQLTTAIDLKRKKNENPPKR